MPNPLGGEGVGFEGVFAGMPGQVAVLGVDQEVAVAVADGI